MRFRIKIYPAFKKIGGGQNTDPQSMDYPDWTIPMDCFSLILLIVTSCTYHYSLFKRSSIEAVYWDSP